MGSNRKKYNIAIGKMNINEHFDRVPKVIMQFGAQIKSSADLLLFLYLNRVKE
jgi:hypothetical protein